MKKILSLMCLFLLVLTLVACNNANAINEHVDAENAQGAGDGVRNVLVDGYFIVSEGNASISVKISEGVIESLVPVSTIENWQVIKSQVEGLDASGLTSLNDADFPVEVFVALQQLLQVTDSDLVFDFAPKNVVADFVNSFGGMVISATTGYYSDHTTFNEVATDVDFNDYMDSEIIAIALEGETGRLVPIFEMEGYTSGYYAMGAGGPALVEYNRIHNAGGLTIIIGVEAPVLDESEEEASVEGAELTATANLIDFRDELNLYGFKNFGFYKGSSSNIGEEITDLDAYLASNPFARLSSFATFDADDQRSNLVIYYDFAWMGMQSTPDVSIENLSSEYSLKVFVGGAEGEGRPINFTDGLDLVTVGRELLAYVGSGMGGQNPVNVMLEDGSIEAVTSVERFEELASEGYLFNGSGKDGGNFRFYTSKEYYTYAAYNTDNSAWEMMSRGQWLGPVMEEHFTSGAFRAVMKLGK